MRFFKNSGFMLAGALLVVAIQTCALFHFGFIRKRDPLAGEKAVKAAYWEEVYATIAVNPQDEER